VQKGARGRGDGWGGGVGVGRELGGRGTEEAKLHTGEGFPWGGRGKLAVLGGTPNSWKAIHSNRIRSAHLSIIPSEPAC